MKTDVVNLGRERHKNGQNAGKMSDVHPIVLCANKKNTCRHKLKKKQTKPKTQDLSTCNDSTSGLPRRLSLLETY